jgi:hypothetical protein
MQTLGYINHAEKGKILLLVRDSKFTRYVKVRTSGNDGSHFVDEELFLAEKPALVERLLRGEVLTL